MVSEVVKKKRNSKAVKRIQRDDVDRLKKLSKYIDVILRKKPREKKEEMSKKKRKEKERWAVYQQLNHQLNPYNFFSQKRDQIQAFHHQKRKESMKNQSPVIGGRKLISL